jgi:hypothetical protein
VARSHRRCKRDRQATSPEGLAISELRHTTELRNEALDAFLEAKLQEGFEVETRRETHAIIVERGQFKSLLSRIRGQGANRFVVSVDENGEVTMIPAEPKRS